MGGLVYSISGGKLGIIILALGQSGDIGCVCIETIFGLSVGHVGLLNVMHSTRHMGGFNELGSV